jgi:hypothetical protein
MLQDYPGLAYQRASEGVRKESDALVFLNSRGYSEKNMERAVPILPADDLAVAEAFYVNGLGFHVTFEASENGQSGLLGLERGKCN